MSTELQAGQVTVADLYREMTGTRADVAKALTRIELIDQRNAAADRLDTDHETRIRALETFRWKLAGVVLVVVVILSPLAAVITALLTKR